MLRCCWRPVIQLGRLISPRCLSSKPPPKDPLTLLTALHAFLAPANLRSQQPVTYTAKDLHKLYLSVKTLPSRPEGHPLNTYELNQLLSLFGTLSIPPPRPKCIYLHSFAPRIPSKPFRTYWSLVLELAEEIRVRKQRKPRTGTHHYWVMRALLARVGENPQENGNWASEATARYLRIRNTSDPEVHVPYLRTMLTLRRDTHLAQTANHLCRFLEGHANPNVRFAELLWNVVLGGGTTAPIRERVLSTLWTRLGRFSDASTARSAIPALYAFDTVSKRHLRLGVTVSQLCAALAMPIFPHLRVRLPAAVSTWAAAEARATFNPKSSVASRWNSLAILALYAAPAAQSRGSLIGTNLAENGAEDDSHIAWRTVFALAIFERTVEEEGKMAVRRLWRTWRNTKIEAPMVVQSVVMSAFFRLAAKTRDGPLVDACMRYCVEHALWGSQSCKTKADVTQITELLVDYVHAKLRTTAPNREDLWSEIFSALPTPSKSASWDALVADTLLREYLSQDEGMAQQLLQFCQQKQISVSADSVYALSQVLARQYYPHSAIRFLDDERLSPDQTEDLLDRILRTLRRERHAFRDISLARVLCLTLKRLYIGTDRAPHPRTKFSLRYALGVLAESGYPVEAAALLRVIHQRQPAFFSTHYFLRIMRILVRRRRTAAVSLLNSVQSFPLAARLNFRRKLALRLARTGAHTLAQYTYRFGGVREQQRTGREILARTVRFRVNFRDCAPARRSAARISAIIARRPTHIPTVRYGVALLARVGRINAAKRSVEGARAVGMSSATVTWLGNAVLNGALHRTKSKYARLVRHVLQNRDQLERRAGFVQDRVTVNILVKALLRWKTFMNAPRIRRLFDHMVRSGYPVPVQWRRGGGVPFGTSVALGSEAGHAIGALKLSPFISFDRHVRPLYRMFIKALFLQGDVRGARTVVGILHGVQEEVLLRRHSRRRARLAGIVRKKAEGRNKM